MIEEEIDKAIRARKGESFYATVHDAALTIVAIDPNASVGVVCNKEDDEVASFVAVRGVVTLGRLGEYCSCHAPPVYDRQYRIWTLYDGVWADCGEGPWQDFHHAEHFAEAECGTLWAIKLEDEFVAWENPMRAPISSSPYC
jgi:hypothetical protein